MKFLTILKLCVVMALGAALTACQTAKSADTPVAVPVVASPLDTKIADFSRKLAKQCFLVGIAIAGAKTFGTDPTVAAYIAAAEPTRKRFCDAPPADLEHAIEQLADLLLDINRAVNRAPASATPVT